MDANGRDLLRDRSWMNYRNASDRRKPEYEDGVNVFLDFAFSNAGNNEKIRCPCVNCYLGSCHDRKVVFYHLLARGIIKDYNPWTQHGEDENEEESIPYEIHLPISYEEHLPNRLIENNVRDSREEKGEGGHIHRAGKENPGVHPENGDSPDAGGDVHQENDDDDDNGDQDVSLVEDDNFIGVNHCDSSPNQSSDDADFVAGEAEQVAAEGDSSEAAQAANSGDRNKSNVRHRGPRRLKWKKKMEMSSDRVKVELPANLGRVVGSNARKFVTEASRLLKQTLPPNVVKWRDLNPNDVAKLLEKVKNRFIFPNESHVDTALLWQFKQWFRHWRADLRRSYFNKYETYEEQLANRSPDVEEAQWKWLVDYWSSEKFRNLSSINAKVRSGQRTIACVGATSIARYAYELEMNQSEQDSVHCPVYLKLFERQKRRSDGTWINKEAEDGYSKLVNLHKKQLEDHGIDNLTPSEAFNKVFSRARSLTLLGIGENPIAFERSSSSKHKRTGCSDKRIIEAVVRARAETQFEETGAIKEAQIERNQSDRQLHAEMREQIRLIRARVDTPIKQTGADKEDQIEQNQSDRQLLAEMREQIRLIRARVDTQFEQTGSKEAQIEQNQDNHPKNEDGDGDSPVIPPNVWKYINAIGMSKTEKTDAGADVHQEIDDDNGDQDMSIGEDNNFTGVNHCVSSPNQSIDDADFVATEAEQVAAEGDSSEAAQAANSGNRNKSNVRRRGPRDLKFKKEMETRSDRVKVELPANLGRVVGSNARQFVSEASRFLKQTLPPNVVKWRDLNPNDVAELLEKVKDRFIFPNESHVDTALLWQFKQWFRHWRSDLRRSYFNRYETYEEQLANRPPDVEETQWKWLVDYWSSEKFRSLSSINAKVRSGQRTIACVGSTSIARYAYELEKNQSEQDSDQCPVYLKLFERQKRSDGTWINKEAEDGYNKLVNLHKKQLEDHGIDNLTPSEAFNKVLSRARSITLLGLGGENPIALENSNSSKRKRRGCSDKSVIESAGRARLETQFEETETVSDEEAPVEQNQSARQMRSEMREQIRLIRQASKGRSSK